MTSKESSIDLFRMGIILQENLETRITGMNPKALRR